MTHKDPFRQKHPPEAKVNPSIAEAAERQASEKEIPCAAAFTIARDLGVFPSEVGETLDLMGVRIVKCQMGLYGYKPKKRIVEAAGEVSAELEREIRGALVNERLPCRAAWAIGERFGIRKMEVSSACEALKIKIAPCQLGSF
jgi:hypothetical protein